MRRQMTKKTNLPESLRIDYKPPDSKLLISRKKELDEIYKKKVDNI